QTPRSGPLSTTPSGRRSSKRRLSPANRLVQPESPPDLSPEPGAATRGHRLPQPLPVQARLPQRPGQRLGDRLRGLLAAPRLVLPLEHEERPKLLDHVLLGPLVVRPRRPDDLDRQPA